MKELAKSLELNTENAEAHKVLGRVLALAGRYDLVITSKPAMHDRVKTGHGRPSGTRFFYPAAGSVGKSVLVRQLRGPHLST